MLIVRDRSCCAKVLLELLNDDQEAADKRRALHYGAHRGSKRMLELLKERGFAINNPDVNGWLPLHWTSASGHSEYVRILCE